MLDDDRVSDRRTCTVCLYRGLDPRTTLWITPAISLFLAPVSSIAVVKSGLSGSHTPTLPEGDGQHRASSFRSKLGFLAGRAPVTKIMI